MGCKGSKSADVLNAGAAGVQAVAAAPHSDGDRDVSGCRELTRAFNGTKKSLLVGINYLGQQGQLNGCINDVKAMLKQVQTCGFTSDPNLQKVLIEEAPYEPPTRANITKGMQWLVQGAKPGDQLFMHYSGHGGQMRDKDSDESDGKDETLVPLDYTSAGQIPDDEIYDILVEGLPQGVRLTVLFDCCHSGTAMDMPYIYKATEEAAASGAPAMAGNSSWIGKIIKFLSSKGLGAATAFMGANGGKIGPMLQKLSGMSGMLGGLTGGLGGGGGGGARDVDLFGVLMQQAPPELANKVIETRDAMAEVVMFSGCADAQTSADVGNVGAVFTLPPNVGAGGAGGACTNALLTVLSQGGEPTFAQVLDQMRGILKQKGFAQIPQLSSSVKIDIGKEKFFMLPA